MSLLFLCKFVSFSLPKNKSFFLLNFLLCSFLGQGFLFFGITSCIFILHRTFIGLLSRLLGTFLEFIPLPIPTDIGRVLNAIANWSESNSNFVEKVWTSKVQVSALLTFMDSLNDSFELWVLRSGRVEKTIARFSVIPLLLAEEKG